jgi:cytochrome b6-f complex iron-sulfur subunit
MSRRRFLETGWKVGGALLVGAAGWTAYESLRPLAETTSGGTVDLGNPSRYAADTATYVPAGRLWVANTGTVIYALSQKCPHLGCRVPYCDSSGRFECPCHCSTYDIGGEWIKGPAPRGMDRYPLAVDKASGNLVADTSKTIDGPPRGTDRFLTPPKGPSCIPGA